MRNTVAIALLLHAALGAAQADLSLVNPIVSNSSFTRLIGTMPSPQIGSSILVGGTAKNFGPGMQTNVLLDIYIQGPVSFVWEVPFGNIAEGDSITVVEPMIISMLPQGIYTVTYSLLSAQSGSDPDMSNNVQERYFGVHNGFCALDGIGATPAAQTVTGSLGTWTFAGEDDALTLMSYINLKTTTTLTGFEALLAPATQAGGFVVFAIADTTDILGQFAVVPIVASDVVDVSPSMVADGRITGVPTIPTVLPPGGYYVTISLFSLEGQYPIGIRDDLTCERGALESLIALLPGEVYSNGNALAVRMLTSGAATCYAEYVVTQAVDGIGEPVPFVLDLVNTSSADTPSSMWSWLWDFGNGTTSTQQYPSHTYATNGPYEICLTLNDGLTCTSTFCDSIGVDDDGLFSRNGFTVNVVPEGFVDVAPHAAAAITRAFPNPTKAWVLIGPVEPGAAVDVAIIDATGKQVSASREMPGADGNMRIDLHRLSPGIYSVTMNQNGRYVRHAVLRSGQ